MKTILTALLAALALACPASERTDNEALMRQCEQGAVAQAAQRPDVVMLRQRLRATTDPRERDMIVQRLEAIHLAALQAGRRAALAAIWERQEASREAARQFWEAERDRQALVWALQNIRR